MYGQQRWTVTALESVKLLSKTICEIATKLCVIVSPQSMLFIPLVQVRQQYAVKCLHLLSNAILITL
mgnify:CR=1 FL=1